VKKEPQLLFREDQQFRQPWLWVFLLMGSAVAMGTVVFFIMQLLTEGNADANPTMPLWVVLALGAVLFFANAGVVALFGFARLQTEVTTAGLFLRFIPFHRKVRKIVLDEVTGVEAVRAKPWAHYGGYGIRRARMASAYIVNGDVGVRINYENGCHIFLGTQHPKELKAAIDAVVK